MQNGSCDQVAEQRGLRIIGTTTVFAQVDDEFVPPFLPELPEVGVQQSDGVHRATIIDEGVDSEIRAVVADRF